MTNLRALSGDAFSIQVPQGWTDRQEGSRLIFEGPRGEELMMSPVVIAGIETEAQRTEMRSKLVGDFVQLVHDVCLNPQLEVVQPLQRQNEAEITRWIAKTISRDRTVSFGAAVFEVRRGALLLFLEGPNDEITRSLFELLAQSVQPAGVVPPQPN